MYSFHNAHTHTHTHTHAYRTLLISLRLNTSDVVNTVNTSPLINWDRLTTQCTRSITAATTRRHPPKLPQPRQPQPPLPPRHLHPHPHSLHSHLARRHLTRTSLTMGAQVAASASDDDDAGACSLTQHPPDGDDDAVPPPPIFLVYHCSNMGLTHIPYYVPTLLFSL